MASPSSVQGIRRPALAIQTLETACLWARRPFRTRGEGRSRGCITCVPSTGWIRDRPGSRPSAFGGSLHAGLLDATVAVQFVDNDQVAEVNVGAAVLLVGEVAVHGLGGHPVRPAEPWTRAPRNAGAFATSARMASSPRPAATTIRWRPACLKASACCPTGPWRRPPRPSAPKSASGTRRRGSRGSGPSRRFVQSDGTGSSTSSPTCPGPSGGPPRCPLAARRKGWQDGCAGRPPSRR